MQPFIQVVESLLGDLLLRMDELDLDDELDVEVEASADVLPWTLAYVAVLRDLERA